MDKSLHITQTDTRASDVHEYHPEKLVASGDVDDALLFLEQHEQTGEVTTIDDKKLMRKVDWLLMPLMFAVYYLQYTDKTLCEEFSVATNHG